VTALVVGEAMLVLALVAHRTHAVFVASIPGAPGVTAPAVGGPAPQLALGLAVLAAVGFVVLQARALLDDGPLPSRARHRLPRW
jgi:hypothetical protein